MSPRFWGGANGLGWGRFQRWGSGGTSSWLWVRPAFSRGLSEMQMPKGCVSPSHHLSASLSVPPPLCVSDVLGDSGSLHGELSLRGRCGVARLLLSHRPLRAVLSPLQTGLDSAQGSIGPAGLQGQGEAGWMCSAVRASQAALPPDSVVQAAAGAGRAFSSVTSP